VSFFLKSDAWRRHQRLIGVIAFVLALLVLVKVTGISEHFNLEYVHDQFESHMLLGLVIFIALFCAGNLIQIPGLIFLAAAVLSLGQFWGGVATLLAAYVSCAVTFWVFRWLGGDSLTRVSSPLMQHLLKRLHTHPVLVVFALRSLFQTSPALNVALAMSAIGIRPYLLGTLLGLPLPLAFYCLFFDFVGAFVRSH
jgi:uncharacterized membrane protein YdjX (TVP38/TMEM64 family)